MKNTTRRAITIGRVAAVAVVPGYIPVEVVHYGAKRFGLYDSLREAASNCYYLSRDFVLGDKLGRVIEHSMTKFGRDEVAPNWMDEI